MLQRHLYQSNNWFIVYLQRVVDQCTPSSSVAGAVTTNRTRPIDYSLRGAIRGAIRASNFLAVNPHYRTRTVTSSEQPKSVELNNPITSSSEIRQNIDDWSGAHPNPSDKDIQDLLMILHVFSDMVTEQHVKVSQATSK